MHFFQLNEEFEGILGGGTVKKIADNWANCVPKIISVAQTSKSKAVVSILSFYSDLSVFGIQHFILIFYCQFCNILFFKHSRTNVVRCIGVIASSNLTREKKEECQSLFH